MGVAEEAGDAVHHAEVLVGVEGDDFIPRAVVPNLDGPREESICHRLFEQSRPIRTINILRRCPGIGDVERASRV